MGMCVSKPANKDENDRHTERALTPGATATITPLQGTKSSDQDILQQTSGELPIAKESYGAEEVQKPRAARSSLDARRQGTSSPEPAEGSVSPEDGTGASSSDADDPQLMKEYIRLAEMLRYSPYPVSLIAIEEDNQPFVFVNNVFCERLGFTDTDVIGKSWQLFLQTPFRHEIHSDVQGRIQEAFETGCEFREVAACYSQQGDIFTFQLLFLPVSKDVDSGITHYVCIHVASEITTKAARELDPTSPVALPKLPNGMAETPTARHVSVTMKNYRPEMVLGGSPHSPVTEGGLPIRMGSFSGKPITPRARRGASNLGGPAGGSDPSGSNPKPKAAFSKSKSKAKSRFAPAGSEEEVEEEDNPVSPLAVGPLGNLRHDSALMGALTNTKGKQALPERVPRTKEEVWLQRMRNLLTSPLEAMQAQQP
ncbi:hypothetical protein ABBQ38_001187 [Trebouxia sp. C0009 RCD-2024]